MDMLNYGNENTNKLTTEQWLKEYSTNSTLLQGNSTLIDSVLNSNAKIGRADAFVGVDDTAFIMVGGAAIVLYAVGKAIKDGNVSVSDIVNGVSDTFGSLSDKLLGNKQTQEKAESLLEAAGATATPPNPFDPNEEKDNSSNNKQTEEENKEVNKAQQNENGSFFQNLRDKIGTRKVDVDKIEGNPKDDFMNPKIGESPKAYREHMDYIRKTGTIKEPIDVKRLPNGNYQIVDGHHRWLAARSAGLKKIPVRVVNK
jgi:hypothetical protein